MRFAVAGLLLLLCVGCETCDCEPAIAPGEHSIVVKRTTRQHKMDIYNAEFARDKAWWDAISEDERQRLGAKIMQGMPNH